MLSEMIYSMIVFSCIGAVICVILRVIICWKIHQKYVLVKEVPIILLSAYSAGLFAMTVPVYSRIRYGNQMVNGVYHSLNLIPFRTIVEYALRSGSLGGISLANVLGNILLFVPMGILLPIVFKRCNRLWRSIIIGAIISGLIEIAQYFLGRSADIDDVLLNAMGTAVGYAVYHTVAVFVISKPEEK